jgi:hypothetical protein
MYNKKGRLIGEMILEGEMANKKHLLEAKLGYCKNKLLGVQVKNKQSPSSDSSNTTQSPM